MTFGRNDLHVYEREISQEQGSSLSLLAGLIPPGARVLDLGTGSGALGRFLAARGDTAVDGVTYNQEEATRARPHYRRVEVADLEQPDWVDAFHGEQYERIVCADVLEHLRQPEQVLRACRQLLGPGGQVLISVPNAAYSGLIAELMEGDFRYRDEGLLDRTHLRFFTRHSLQQFLRAEGWTVNSLQPVSRPLTESEFRGAFHRLPPAVARYLLALPDAATYQLIGAVQPAMEATQDADRPAEAMPAQAQALFSVQLYLGDETGFSEDRKVVQAGVMGAERQTIRFALTPGPGLHGLRLDPADRTGFLHLHALTLRQGAVGLWQWRCEVHGLSALESAPHQDLLWRSPWPATAAMILVHGPDPYIDLPVPREALAAGNGETETVLEVELGWPMSADYLALVETVAPLHQRLETQRLHGLERVQALGREIDALRADLRGERQAAEEKQRALAEAAAREQASNAREQALATTLEDLQQRSNSLAEQRNLLERHRRTLEARLGELNQQHQALAEHLRWIEQSTVFRATRPLVRAKMATERLLGWRAPESPQPSTALPARPQTPPDRPVDIIVPVYRGLADTQLCIGSVLASRNKTAWRLVILNDASPEPDVTEWLREVAAGDERILLLENPQNLGFVGTVNRGMSASAENDALLLNSDTEVANDWLDRLRAAAYSDARVASVTPFSNNATVCSYPLFCQPNDLPPGCDTAGLDAVFAATNAGQVVDVPTGVGFCMYIRRDALAAVGLFDVEQFGKGYGEENDFCRRAADAGWRNLHALDTFVLHTGGVSFGASKSQREREAVEKLRRLHPTYDRLVHAFVQEDPAREARHAVDIARVRGSGLPCVLAVLHDRAGGTLRHVQELAQHLSGRAFFFSLVPVPGAAARLELLQAGAGFSLDFRVPAQWPDLLRLLRTLGVAHVHFHHVMGHQDEVLRLGEHLGVAWDFTAHDYFAMCPHITLTDGSDRYCGEQGGGECHVHDPAAGGVDVARWRDHHGWLLTQARHLLVPSRDTGRRIARMWGSADVRLAPHTDIAATSELPLPHAQQLQESAPLRVAVLGGLSKIKGADLLEDVALLAARAGAPLEFHLVGHAYRRLHTQPKAALTVHGAYEEKELDGLLRWLKPDLVWFPALWPETYSYTLSACLRAGLPVVAPNLGAFPERLSGRKWSWVRPWDTPPEECLAFFLDVRQTHFITGVPPRPHFEVAPALGDPVLPGWSYERDYLAGIAAPAGTTGLPDPTFLAAHRPGSGAGLSGQQRRLKQLALTTLVRLRAAPPLRRVARAIPLRWQTRIKTWLRA